MGSGETHPNEEILDELALPPTCMTTVGIACHSHPPKCIASWLSPDPQRNNNIPIVRENVSRKCFHVSRSPAQTPTHYCPYTAPDYTVRPSIPCAWHPRSEVGTKMHVLCCHEKKVGREGLLRGMCSKCVSLILGQRYCFTCAVYVARYLLYFCMQCQTSVSLVTAVCLSKVCSLTFFSRSWACHQWMTVHGS